MLIRQLTATEQVLTHGSPTTRPGEGEHDRADAAGVLVLRAPDGDAPGPGACRRPAPER